VAASKEGLSSMSEWYINKSQYIPLENLKSMLCPRCSFLSLKNTSLEKSKERLRWNGLNLVRVYADVQLLGRI
jgi:hypothetical protein